MRRSSVLLVLIIFTSDAAQAGALTACHYYYRKLLEKQTVGDRGSYTWLGREFPKNQWEYYRVLWARGSRASFPRPNETLEVMDLNVRRALDESELGKALGGKIYTGQRIEPISTSDRALLNEAFRGTPGEAAVVRLFLKDGQIIEGRKIVGSYRGIQSSTAHACLDDAIGVLRSKGLSESDVLESEFSHVHPSVEFMNLSRGIFHATPLSFNDLSGGFRSEFEKRFPKALFTIRAIVSNGYAYEQSHLTSNATTVTRDVFWRDLGFTSGAPRLELEAPRPYSQGAPDPGDLRTFSTQVLMQNYRARQPDGDPQALSKLESELQRRKIILDRIR